MSALSLEGLQSVLRECKAEQDAIEREKKAFSSRTKPIRDVTLEIWQSLAVGCSPAKDSDQSGWIRPIPDNLYTCSISEPQTTLVSWNSLPANVQAKVPMASSSTSRPDSNTQDVVVEIPRVYIEADAVDVQKDTGGSSNSRSTASSIMQKRRPLIGNLSNKISEYTRGVLGQGRPFRAGGVGDEEAKHHDDDDDHHHHHHGHVDPYRTPDAIQTSLDVLREGTEHSWKSGKMITAPPGVDFKEGLSLELLQAETSADNMPPPQTTQEDDDNWKLSETTILTSNMAFISNSQPQTLQTGLFTKILFDDDSLFGSSDESDDDDDDDDDESGTKEKLSAIGSAADEWTDTSPKTTHVVHASSGAVDNERPVSEEEIDNLLQEFVHSTETPLEKKRSKVLVENPLDLAQHQALLQSNTTKKSWASTQLLPIADFNALVPNPAIEFPFTLDDFQQQAIARLERSESVFVAAHTSAGKTVVAEYAVALAKQRATRCVYTSPIKALSNQKFRDFCVKFGAANVGLVTGDLQVNVDDSTCLIMTTEILRSMLYRGADLIRDIEWVIFDEVHYVNDTERGVVWEEVIIMLPSYVNFIFLSATTPNTIEFSDWIGRTKRKIVHVVTTNFRPVPLSHFLWAGHDLHLIKQGNGPFLESGHRDATQALLPLSAREKKADGKQKPTKAPSGSQNLIWQVQGTKQNWMSLVRYLEREFLTPAVVFSFSKKKCEEIAQMLQSLDLCTGKERGVIQGFTMQTVARLSQIDSKLPQVQLLCEMVQRGIAVHHGGLLPILKEMVEILFSRNLIKILFATETFAMGVNMPAKAVVFNSIRKHDGNQFRTLEPGEYTQMAGRAGRRGLDKVGTVIVCCFGEQPPPVPILRQLLTGSSTQLRSQFRLTYNMILNLLRVEDMSVESMIKRSFSEFATQRALAANEYPQLLAKGSRTLAKLEEQFKEQAAHRFGAEDVEQYFSTSQALIERNRRIIAYIAESDPAALDSIFPVGRLLVVTAARLHGAVRAPAIVLTTVKSDGSAGTEAFMPSLICVALLPAGQQYDSQSKAERGAIDYIGSALGRHYKILKLTIDHVLFLSSEKRKIDVNFFLDERPRSTTLRSHTAASWTTQRPLSDPFAGLKAAGKRNEYSTEALSAAKKGDAITETMTGLIDSERDELDGNGIPILDLRKFLRRGSDVIYYRQLCDEADDLLSKLRKSFSHSHPNLEKYFTVLERQNLLRTKVEKLRHILSNESLQLFPDFLLRKSVLCRLGYIDANETVCVKGRVACEVNTCEELIVTEMVFEGILNDLKPEEIAAALSALVYQDKKEEVDLDAELPQPLVVCCDKMMKIATNLGQLQKGQGLQIDPKEYCDSSLNFGLVHAVFEWSLGVPFKDICALTDAQEGSIVRCITRLDELCREVRNCARVVGNPTLYRKLEDASMAIKRDIVFASSLYVS